MFVKKVMKIKEYNEAMEYLTGNEKPESIVYVLQELPGTSIGRPKYNIIGAQKYGKIKVLLREDTQIVRSPGPITYQLRRLLKNFSDKDLKNTSYQNTVYSMAKQLGYKTFLDQTNLILKRPNQLNKLDKIVSKTLIIRGKNDKLSSNIMNNELNKKIKYSVYTEIKNSSHFVMLEKPKTFNKIITNFLF